MRKLAPIALSAIALLALAGCSNGASGGDGSQTVADACTIANEKMASVQTELNESLSGLGSGDYSAAATTMDTLSASIDEAISEISNADVKAVLTTVSEEITVIGDSIEEIAAAGTDTAKLEEVSETLGESATNLQAAGQELNDLCS